jgi:hypothetical protein
MSFILSNERDSGPDGAKRAFDTYRRYLQEQRERFPAGAWALATSSWYFDGDDHRCPHDGWLEKLEVDEVGTGARRANRICSIRILLLGAYHDCLLELTYPAVHSYLIENMGSPEGVGDWRYDEFRVTDDGRLIHEIEWATPGGHGARWVIEAADVQFNILPLE